MYTCMKYQPRPPPFFWKNLFKPSRAHIRLVKLASDPKINRKLKFCLDVPNTIRNYCKKYPLIAGGKSPKFIMVAFGKSIPILKNILLSLIFYYFERWINLLTILLDFNETCLQLLGWLLLGNKILTCSKFWLEVNSVTKT